MINFRKYIQKFLKTYIYSYEATPITKLNKIKNNDILFSLNSKNKNKEIFYIIKRTPGAGLFSNFIFVLNHIKLADSLSLKPIVDMENFPTIYNESKLVNKSKNAWNYYFTNKKNYKINKILKKNKFIISSNRFSKSFSHSINNKEFRNLFNKYFKINEEHLRFVNEFKKNIS